MTGLFLFDAFTEQRYKINFAKFVQSRTKNSKALWEKEISKVSAVKLRMDLTE